MSTITLTVTSAPGATTFVAVYTQVESELVGIYDDGGTGSIVITLNISGQFYAIPWSDVDGVLSQPGDRVEFEIAADIFELFDPGTGGRLVASINNPEYFDEDDLLIIYNAAGEQVASGPAALGIVNVSGLTTGVAVTLHSRVLVGEDLSGISNTDTETPTTDNAALLVGSPAFAQTSVNFRVGGGTTIEWRLRQSCAPKAPLVFFVQFSNAPDLDGDHWEDVATVVDACLAEDTEQRLFTGMLQLAYYRVIMREIDGTESISAPIQAVGKANRHDFLLAREIFRKESLRLQKFVGARGFLLKAKIFGVDCPDCLDPDTGEVVDSNCTTCFGKGIVGGYHKPIEFFIEPGLASRTLSKDPSHGATLHIVRQCRAIGTPQLDDDDLWVRSDTDERFFIQDISEAARLVVPIVVLCNLRKIPIGDPVYMVPVPA